MSVVKKSDLKKEKPRCGTAIPKRENENVNESPKHFHENYNTSDSNIASFLSIHHLKKALELIDGQESFEDVR